MEAGAFASACSCATRVRELVRSRPPRVSGSCAKADRLPQGSRTASVNPASKHNLNLVDLFDTLGPSAFGDENLFGSDRINAFSTGPSIKPGGRFDTKCARSAADTNGEGGMPHAGKGPRYTPRAAKRDPMTVTKLP